MFKGCCFWKFLIPTQGYVLNDFRERGREGHTHTYIYIYTLTSMWEINIYRLPAIHALTGHQTHNLGICSEQKSNLPYFCVWDSASHSWATWLGHFKCFLKERKCFKIAYYLIAFCCINCLILHQVILIKSI